MKHAHLTALVLAPALVALGPSFAHAEPAEADSVAAARPAPPRPIPHAPT